MISSLVLRGELAGGKVIMAREPAGHQAVTAALCILLFVLYVLLISIVVVSVCVVFFLLNCPYPDSPVLPIFFLFSTPPQQREKR